MMKAVKILWLLVMVVVLAGCSSSVASGGAATKAASSAFTEYRIQPGDQLDVKFFYNPELNEQLTVRSDGRITLQLINDVMAAGLTPAELTSVLTKAYASELSNPKVAVIVRQAMSDKAYVDGEVNRAGPVPLVGMTTALQAIAQAGGMKESAKAEDVILLRRGADNNITTMTLNLKDAVTGADVSQDIMLRPNDIIFVPRSKISNVNLWVDQYIRKNIPIPIGLGYSVN